MTPRLSSHADTTGRMMWAWAQDARFGVCRPFVVEPLSWLDGTPCRTHLLTSTLALVYKQTSSYRIEDTIKDLLGPLLYHWTRIRPVLPTANNPSIPQLGDSFNTVNIILRRSSTLLVCPIEGTAADGKNMYEWCWCFVSRHGTVKDLSAPRIHLCIAMPL